MKAIILSGGKGERLRPFTDTIPKGMIEINGKPIHFYQVQWLKKYGISEIIFACGYLNEIIQNYFSGGKNLGLNISYSIEEKPLGRGGAIKKAWSRYANDENVVVLNGDVLTDLDLSAVISQHHFENNTKNTLATITLFPYKSPYGIVRTNEDGIIQDFEEKRNLPYWINGGIYILEPEFKNYLPDIGDHETTAFPVLAKLGLIFGYKSSNAWKGIDTFKDLNEVQHEEKLLFG